MYARRASTLILSLVAFLWNHVAKAQVLYGSLTGTVSDASGGAVPSAHVQAVNTSTGIAKEAGADERGNYLINDLQAGTYKITITAPSFATVVEQGVTIEANT